MPLFKRTANILVGKPGSVGIELEGFRVTFDIRKTNTRDPNQARIEIYGLSEGTRSRIEEDNQTITLKAGYEEASGPEVIYVGDISYTYPIIQRPEVVTIIEAGDGESTLNSVKDVLSYGPNISVKRILTDIVNSFGLPKKSNLNLVGITDKILNNGFNFSGLLKNAMDIVTKELDLAWSIQNGELKVYLEEGSDQTLAIDISPETGLIGSPEKVRIKKGKIDTKETLEGWRVVSYLQPKAEPGGRILLTSRVVGDRKQFKIVDVQHTGDTEQGNFQTIIQVIE